MKLSPVWNEERDARLCAFWRKGYSETRCAALLSEHGWTPTTGSVHCRLKRLGLNSTIREITPGTHDRQVPRPGTFWTDERVGTLKAIAPKGWSASEMAAHLGGKISRNAVIGKLHRLGLGPSVAAAKATKLVRNAPARMRARAVPRSRPTPARTRVTDHGRQAYDAAPDRPIEPLRTVYTATEPRPWTTRKTFECTWIVVEDGADSLACCAPIARGSWCFAHAEIGFVPPKTNAKEFIRGCRRYAA